MGERDLKHEKRFVYFCLFWPIIIFPIGMVSGILLALGVYSEMQYAQNYPNNRYNTSSVVLYQLLLSYLIITICCSCQLCVCCVCVKCREPSWRKQQQQQQQQQQHPPGVIENAAVHERDLLVSPTHSLPPAYSVATGRDIPNYAQIHETGFQ